MEEKVFLRILLCTNVSEVFSRSFRPLDFNSSYTSRSRRSRARISASFFFTSPSSTCTEDFWKAERLAIEEKLSQGSGSLRKLLNLSSPCRLLSSRSLLRCRSSPAYLALLSRSCMMRTSFSRSAIRRSFSISRSKSSLILWEYLRRLFSSAYTSPLPTRANLSCAAQRRSLRCRFSFLRVSFSFWQAEMSVSAVLSALQRMAHWLLRCAMQLLSTQELGDSSISDSCSTFALPFFIGCIVISERMRLIHTNIIMTFAAQMTVHSHRTHSQLSIKFFHYLQEYYVMSVRFVLAINGNI